MAMALRIFVRGLCDEIAANTRQLSELLAVYRMVVFGHSVNVRLSSDIATIAASLPGFSLERLGTELRAHQCIDGAAAVNGYLGPIGVLLEVIRFDDVQVSRLRPVCRAFNRIARTLLAQQSRGWALILTFIDEFGLPHVCRHVVRVTNKFPVTILLRHYQDACLSVRTACRDTIARHCISGNCRKVQLSAWTAGVELVSTQSTMAYFCGPAQPRFVEIQFGETGADDALDVPYVLVRAA